MKNLAKVLCLVLALVMALSVIACSDGEEETTTAAEGTTAAGEAEGTTAAEEETEDPTIQINKEEYTAKSEEIYNKVLGEFATAYAAAKAETNVSKKYALMAIAEAKLMESAVMLPTSTRGGNYAISRVAPNTVDYTLWGNDSDRYHQALVCTEFIKSADRAEMKTKWGELKGTGEYEGWAKEFLATKGYTLTDTYSLSFTSDPQTWDALATSRAADSEAIVNTFDGLMEYDIEGTLQPALAESYTVSDDGLKYTFTLRQGIKWVDSQGREVADVKADDFVAGMQHSIDADGGLGYLIEPVIAGASDYINKKTTDFTTVGVKAINDTTLEYTLTAPCSYFTTMLGYNIFAPMSRSYYESKGGKFGAEFKADDANYTYGKDPDSIAYNGPYLVSNCTAGQTIVFEANPSYWNKDNINVKKIVWLFNDGSDVTKAYKDAVAGTLSGAGLNAASLELAKADGNFEKYGYISSTDATSYMAFWNINRTIYRNFNNTKAAVSTMTAEQQERTDKAMLNVHFRRAISFAADRAAYNAQSVGEELKLTSLRNTYTPGTFVSLEEEVTVKINGTDKTYPAGTFYGKIMQDQADADGFKAKLFDETADDGIGSSDGYDGWYNAANAAEELNAAIAELGITIDAQNPIYIDLPYPSNSDTYTNKAQSFKKSIEASLGGKVIVNLVECVNYDEWYDAGYYTEFGYEANYTCYDLSGWGPDYGDPSTYLDTFLSDYAGYMIKCIGIY